MDERRDMQGEDSGHVHSGGVHAAPSDRGQNAVHAELQVLAAHRGRCRGQRHHSAAHGQRQRHPMLGGLPPPNGSARGHRRHYHLGHRRHLVPLQETGLPKEGALGTVRGWSQVQEYLRLDVTGLRGRLVLVGIRDLEPQNLLGAAVFSDEWAGGGGAGSVRDASALRVVLGA